MQNSKIYKLLCVVVVTCTCCLLGQASIARLCPLENSCCLNSLLTCASYVDVEWDWCPFCSSTHCSAMVFWYTVNWKVNIVIVQNYIEQSPQKCKLYVLETNVVLFVVWDTCNHNLCFGQSALLLGMNSSVSFVMKINIKGESVTENGLLYTTSKCQVSNRWELIL